MESLSRPFHTRKLSNATSFSGKNAYDGVFSNRQKYNRGGGGGGAGPVEDYSEIFGGSQASAVNSSIPVLDLSAFERESFDAASNLKPDYSKIFGGFRDEEIAVSYEDLFAAAASSSRDNDRAPSSIRPASQELDNLSRQSFDALKQFNMSYNKISQRSENGLDGTTHVAQLHAVPGYTCFIDEPVPPSKMEARKQKSSIVNNVVNTSKVDFPEKRTSGSASKSRGNYQRDGSFSDDKNFNTVETNLKSHPSSVPSNSASPTSVNNLKDSPRRSSGMNSGTSKSNTSESAPGEFSPTYFDEELDVNSAAAASVAALKEAIEKAQESIRIAKESVGRRKEGLRSFSKKSFKESLKVKSRMENVTIGKEHEGKDTIGEFERVCAGSQVLPDMGRNQKNGGTVVFSDFTNSEKLFVAKKVIDEIQGKISESAKKCEIAMQSSHESKYNGMVSNSTEVTGEMKARTLDSAANYKPATWVSEVVGTGKSRTVAFEQEDRKTNMTSVHDSEHKVEPSRATDGIVEDQSFVKELELVEEAGEWEAVGELDAVRIGAQEGEGGGDGCRENGQYEAPQENEESKQKKVFVVHEGCDNKLGEFEETMEHKNVLRALKDNGGEVRLSSTHEFSNGNNNLRVSQKVEGEEKIPQGSNENGFEKRLTEAPGLLEHKSQQEVEREYTEKVKDAQRQEEDAGDVTSDQGLEEVFISPENVNELEEDHSTASHKEEEVDERFYDVCNLEMNKSTETYSDSMEKSEASGNEDCEMKQEDNLKVEEEEGETGKRFDEVRELETLSDDNDKEESKPTIRNARNVMDDSQEACKVDISSNNVEASQEVDVISGCPAEVLGASFEFQVEEMQAIKAVYRSEEEEISEETSEDQTTSENEGAFDVKADNLVECGLADMDFGVETEQNDIRSESSSDTNVIHSMEIEANKSKEGGENSEEEKIVFVEEKKENNLQPSNEERPRLGSEVEVSQEPSVLNEAETTDINKEIKTSQCGEKKDGVRETGSSKVEGKDHSRRIDEVTESQKEREKNKLAVERAIREARERAFAEARERAERAAVERATAEVRQRVMADAREKAAKASAATKPFSERTSVQSKLRAERAAVERATAEARQRALEKAMSQKSNSETRSQANGIRHSSSSSDLNSSNGTSTESAQRSKAKLEKHNRIMERAAKALAEKEKRDLLAQKEQAERNRLAEALDADIKRWSSGKEGNLRALLSTLQYILGPDSGWQSVTLTEIITTSAVKKAYRKATLCVHPDKLQQRGANIQQKYICEKVFDLLKAAWNRFNSEER